MQEENLSQFSSLILHAIYEYSTSKSEIIYEFCFNDGNKHSLRSLGMVLVGEIYSYDI